MFYLQAHSSVTMCTTCSCKKKKVCSICNCVIQLLGMWSEYVQNFIEK